MRLCQMQWISRITLCSLFLLDWSLADNILLLSDDVDAKEISNVSITGYLPDYRALSIDVPAAASQLNDLILFSIEMNSRGFTGGCCLGEDHYAVVKQAREANPNLKVWVAVGGQGRNQAWPEVAREEKKRERFIKSMARLCKKEGLDGIDLDLYSAVRTYEEHNLFLNFLSHASSVWGGEGLLLSVPLHVRQEVPKEAYSFIDRVHLMTYDSPMSSSATDMEETRLKHTHLGVQTLLKSGCPSFKVWIGVPLYGSSVSRPGTVEAMYDPFPDKEAEKDKFQQPADAISRIQSEFQGFQWDSPSIIRSKMQMVRQDDLGGIFLWELGQDFRNAAFPGGLLLTSIADATRDGNTRTSRNNEL